MSVKYEIGYEWKINMYKSVNVCIEGNLTMYRRIKDENSSLSNNYAKQMCCMSNYLRLPNY